jgi:hypothetical protein
MREPAVATPPAELGRAKAKAMRHPAVAKAGLTTTDHGDWALKLWLRRGVPAPPDDLVAQLRGLPVLFEEEPATLPVARPAYPGQGE